MPGSPFDSIVNQFPDTDTFFARVYGRHVLCHLFFDEGAGPRRRKPTCTPEHAAFYANLAASYGRRALAKRDAHAIEVQRGWVAVRLLLGEVL